MIKTLTNTTITQICGGCGQENEIAVSGLEAGHADGSEDCVILPNCPNCFSGEVLIRTHDATASPHGLVVNRLHKRLKDAAQKCADFPGDDEDATALAADKAEISVKL